MISKITTSLFMVLFAFSGLLQAQNHFMEVQSESGLDTFEVSESAFTPNRCDFPFTDTIVIAYDDAEDSTLYCSGTGGNDISGKIALIDRNDCNFDLKVKNAENNGATGVIICNRVDSLLIMSGETSSAIPAVLTFKTACDTIRARINREEIVTATFKYMGDTTTNSRTVLWGANSGEGDFAGGLNGWTFEGNTCAGSPYTGEVWKWQNEPFVQGIPSDNNYAFRTTSETFCNGFVAFNSQHLDAGEGELGSAEGECPSFQTGSVVSPTIDLSAHDGPISVNFYQDAILFQGNFYLDYSEDGGDTWVETEINTEIGTNESITGYRSVNLWTATPTATFKIRFRAELDYYYWSIDDVTITEAPTNDFEVNTILPPPNFVTPASQVDSILLASAVYNLGQNPLYNVQNYFQVSYFGDNGLQTIYLDSFLLDTLGFQDSFIIAADALYDVPSQPGVYTISGISIDSARTDEDQSNNIQTIPFLVSEDFYSKDDSELLSIVPTAENGQYTYANVYRTGISNNAFRADSAIINPGTNFEEFVGSGTITVGLYEWVDADSNFVSSNSERTAIAFGEYQISSDYERFEYVTIPLEHVENTLNNQVPITLKDTTTYILSYEWIAPAGAQSDISVTVGSIDYLFAGRVPYGPISLFSGGTSTDWEITVFQGIGYVAPVIRLSITDEELNNTTSAEDAIQASLSMYPNPASEFVNIELNLNDYVSDVHTTVYNIEGKVMQQHTFQNIRELKHQLQLGMLPTGLYLVEFRTDKGSYSERILKY